MVVTQILTIMRTLSTVAMATIFGDKASVAAVKAAEATKVAACASSKEATFRTIREALGEAQDSESESLQTMRKSEVAYYASPAFRQALRQAISAYYRRERKAEQAAARAWYQDHRGDNLYDSADTEAGIKAGLGQVLVESFMDSAVAAYWCGARYSFSECQQLVRGIRSEVLRLAEAEKNGYQKAVLYKAAKAMLDLNVVRRLAKALNKRQK